MIVLKIKDLEKQLGKLVKRNITCLGVDTASRTGWCIIKTTDKEANIDYGFIDIDSKDRNFKFNQMIDMFPNLIKGCDVVVIEDVFLKFNVMVHSFLSRIGMIVYVICHQQGIKSKDFIWASTARKNLGLKGNAKKDIIHKEFTEKFGIKIDDEDIMDSIILALNGIIQKL
jgi:Holliday junction resolvasome RuvABC endonuclease subunit